MTPPTFKLNSSLFVLIKMEPEVHLIEKYLGIVEGFFTMTNIKVDRREIDLLAIHPISGEKLHVESTVHTNRKLNIQHLDRIAKSKFNHPSIVNSIRALFHTTDYKKILVVWNVKDGEVIEKAEKYGIEIKYVGDLLMELVSTYMALGAKGSRDPIMRTVELMALIGKIWIEKKYGKKSKNKCPKWGH